jgi:NitT/TauT family transport system ATP-binding protein
MIYLQTKNLSVFYKNNCILNNLNFSAKQGEFIVIIGKSGSGKTTFLNALANLIPFSGEIKIAHKLGFVFQQYPVFPWLTVSQNIAFGLDNYPKQSKSQIIQKHLKMIGLETKKDSYSAQLSSGQKQRVALARSLAHRPKVLLMDEPYGALDYYTKLKMQKWLLNIWSKHKNTIIFITHDIEEAIFLADRILVLKNKKFQEDIRIPFTRPRLELIKFTPEFNQFKKSILKLFN